jgi:hypothetical protein
MRQSIAWLVPTPTFTRATVGVGGGERMRSLPLQNLTSSFFVIKSIKFRYRSETTETNCFETNRKKPKKNRKKRKNPKFSVKIANYAPYQLFWLVFCLYRFNRNIETLCFGIEAKQRNKRFVSDSAETSFGSSFGCFEGHPTWILIFICQEDQDGG